MCLPWLLPPPSKGLHLVLLFPSRGLSVLVLFLCYRSLPRRRCSEARQSFSDCFLSTTYPTTAPALRTQEAVTPPPFKELTSVGNSRKQLSLSVRTGDTSCWAICVLNPVFDCERRFDFLLISPLASGVGGKLGWPENPFLTPLVHIGEVLALLYHWSCFGSQTKKQRLNLWWPRHQLIHHQWAQAAVSTGSLILDWGFRKMKETHCNQLETVLVKTLVFSV